MDAIRAHDQGADRYDRRILRMRLDVFRAAVMTALVGLILFDQESMIALFVVAALLSSAEAVVDSSSAAMVPATVDQADLGEMAHGVSAVVDVGDAPLAVEGPPIGAAVAGAAAVVDVEHRKTAAGPVLGAKIERRAGSRGGAAMAFDQEWLLL